MEKLDDVVAVGLRPAKAHEHGKKEENGRSEAREQSEYGCTDEPAHKGSRNDIPLRWETSSTLLRWAAQLLGSRRYLEYRHSSLPFLHKLITSLLDFSPPAVVRKSLVVVAALQPQAATPQHSSGRACPCHVSPTGQ